jgi:hypothetical protein
MGGIQFIDHIQVSAIRVKGQVPGSCPWSQAEKRLGRMGGKLPTLCIKCIDHDLVGSQIGDQQEFWEGSSITWWAWGPSCLLVTGPLPAPITTLVAGWISPSGFTGRAVT